jgi:predicted permease
VTEIIIYLGTPALVFSSLASRPLLAGDIAILFGGILLIFAGGRLACTALFFFFRFSSRGFVLPCLFYDSDRALANSLAKSFLLNLLNRQKLRRSLDSMNHSL